MNEYVNPEPPPEIAKIKKEDQIGNTLFSKHWLCNLLLKLIKKLNEDVSETDESDRKADIDKTKEENIEKDENKAKELDVNIEKDLCDLWDMTVEREVCIVLDELNSTEIFEGYIKKFDQVYPRAIEILIGILVNMATNSQEIALKLAEKESLIHHLFFRILGQMEDVHSVIQTFSLFSIFITNESTTLPLSRIKSEFIEFLKKKDLQENDSNWTSILENFIFILEQSLNPILLDSAIQFLYDILDCDDDELMISTISERIVEAVCNAAMTRIKLERVRKTFNHSNFTNKTDEKSSLVRNKICNETPTPSTSRQTDMDSCVYTSQHSEEEISAIDKLVNKYYMCLQTMSICEIGVMALFLKFDNTKQLFNDYLDKCLMTLNDWEIKSANSLKNSIGEESLQNLLCMLSILNCIFLNQPSDQKLDGSHIEFLIKLVSFSKHYLKLFIQVKISDKNLSGSYELVKTNLKDLFKSISKKEKYESYHYERLTKLMVSCNSML